MVNDLQKAGLWKRFAAWMFDGILTCIIAVGIAFVLSMLLGYDKYSDMVLEAYEKYETEYGVDFDISAEEYDAFSESEKENYDNAYKALISDEDAIYAYNMNVNLSLVIITVSILISVMAWEFVVPIILKNGQTLGKKIFGICLMKTNQVKINNAQLLIRTLLGKFTIETMIPVYALMMLFWGSLNIIVLIILLVLYVIEAASAIVTETNSLVHDLLAGTVVVDASSQMIFEDEQELIEYKNKKHAEDAARKSY